MKAASLWLLVGLLMQHISGKYEVNTYGLCSLVN
jgi:hypothetical protein